METIFPANNKQTSHIGNAAGVCMCTLKPDKVVKNVKYG